MDIKETKMYMYKKEITVSVLITFPTFFAHSTSPEFHVLVS